MKREVNPFRLKLILKGLVPEIYTSSQAGGMVDDDFTIYLDSGEEYHGKRGYTVFWDDDEVLVIQETHHTDDFQESNFLEGLLGAMFQGAVVDKVEIRWDEISDISSR